jgi:hypothetical protein
MGESDCSLEDYIIIKMFQLILERRQQVDTESGRKGVQNSPQIGRAIPIQDDLDGRDEVQQGPVIKQKVQQQVLELQKLSLNHLNLNHLNSNLKKMIISKLVDIFKNIIKDEESKPNWIPGENVPEK